MLTVCTFLWYDPQGVRNDIYVYDESHVHRLKRMVEKNLSLEHEFICVSDRKIDGIKTIPLDFTTFVHGTRFAKLMMYAPAGALAGKRLLFLHPDTVVTGRLDSVVDRNEDLVLWRNPNFGTPGRARYNTSIILHTAGTRTEFWTEFDRKTTLATVQQATGWGGTDQAWISYRASPEEAHWTDAHGVFGAGRLKTASAVPGDVYT